MKKDTYTIKDAFVEAVNREADMLPLTDPFPASEKHQKKMSSLFKEKGSFTDRFVRALPRVALAAVTLCLLTAGIMWLMSMSSLEMAGFTIDKINSDVHISDKNKEIIRDSLTEYYTLATLSEDFALAEVIEDSDTTRETKWIKDDGTSITLTQSIEKEQTWSVTRQADYDQTTVNEQDALYYSTDDSQTVMWIEDGYVFKATAENIPVEEVINSASLTSWEKINYSAETLASGDEEMITRELIDILKPIVEEYENGVLLRKTETVDGKPIEHCIVVKSVNGNLRIFDFDRFSQIPVGFCYNAVFFTHFVFFGIRDVMEYDQIKLNDGSAGYEKYYEQTLNCPDIDDVLELLDECYTILFYMQNDTSYFFDSESPDITINGVGYYKASSRWQSYDNFKRYLLSLMTEEMVAANLAYSTKNINGELYFRKIGEESPEQTDKKLHEFSLRFVEKVKGTLRFNLSFKDEYGYIVAKETDDGYKVAYFCIESAKTLISAGDWNTKYKFSEEYLSYRADDMDEEERIPYILTEWPHVTKEKLNEQ